MVCEKTGEAKIGNGSPVYGSVCLRHYAKYEKVSTPSSENNKTYGIRISDN